jgi:hypothetical protein
MDGTPVDPAAAIRTTKVKLLDDEAGKQIMSQLLILPPGLGHSA